MRVEIVAVGTELLLGQVVDTNSTWIAGQLADAGLDVLHTSCVGDNPGRILAQLQESIERADAVIVCGGLGPTQDDLTRDVIADLLGTPLVNDQSLADEIAEVEEKYRKGKLGNLPLVLADCIRHRYVSPSVS